MKWSVLRLLILEKFIDRADFVKEVKDLKHPEETVTTD